MPEGPFLQDFLKTTSQPSSRPSQATKGSSCLSALQHLARADSLPAQSVFTACVIRVPLAAEASIALEGEGARRSYSVWLDVLSRLGAWLRGVRVPLEGAGVGDMRGGFGGPSFRVGGRPWQDKNLPSTSHSPCPLPSGSPSAHQTDCAGTTS